MLKNKIDKIKYLVQAQTLELNHRHKKKLFSTLDLNNFIEYVIIHNTE